MTNVKADQRDIANRKLQEENQKVLDRIMSSKPTVKLEELLKHERQYKKLKKRHNVGFNNAKHGYPARGSDQFSIPRIDTVLNESRNISPSMTSWQPGISKRRNSQVDFPPRSLRLQNIHERSGQSMVHAESRNSSKDDERTVSGPQTIGSSIQDKSMRATQGPGFSNKGMVSGTVNMNQTF